nr:MULTISPECIES: 3'-5' exonuclease [unclassified Fusibacter]
MDTETTGLSKTDEIVEIAVINLDGKVLLNTLVKPKKRIPDHVIKIHGITNEMVEHAPVWEDVWFTLMPYLMSKTMIAYNAMFDVGMIRQSCEIHGIKAPYIKQLDMMAICKNLKGYRPKLESFATKKQEHRALADTLIILEDIILANLDVE